MTERTQRPPDGASVAPRGPLLAGCVALAAAIWLVSAWWLGRNELPDGYQNEFLHLYTLTEIWFRLRDEGLGAAWPFLWEGYWPPGMHLPVLGAFAVLGGSVRAAVLVLALGLVPLLVATGELGRRLGGAWVGGSAVVVVACAPAIFGSARRYEPNLLLAACVVVALWWLARGGLRSGRDALGFGLLCAAGLLVDRLVFAVYLAGPAVAWLAARPEQRRRWAIVAGVVLVLAGPYYALFVAEHAGEVTSQLGGEIDATGARGDALGPLAYLGYYPLSWLDGDLGLPLGLFVLVGLAGWLRVREAAPDEVRRTLESALAVALLVFTVVAKKQPYYALPLIAPAAVLAAAGWGGILRGRGRVAVLAAIAVLGANQVAFRSTGRAPLPVSALTGGAVLGDLLGERYVLAGPPLELGLDLERAAALCGDGFTMLASDEPKEGLVLPVLRFALDRGDVPGRTVESEAWDEHGPRAECLIWLGGDGGATDATAGRGRPLGRWGRDPGPRVHVYALSPAPR